MVPVAVLVCLLGVGHVWADTDLFHRLPSAGDPGQPTVVEDPANVVGGELLGSWAPDAGLNRAFTPDEGSRPFAQLQFRRDARAEQRALAKLASWVHVAAKRREGPELRDAVRRIYLAGRCTLRWEDGEREYDFALLTLRGNPTLILWGGCEITFTAMLAADLHGDRDLLFLVREDLLFGKRYKRCFAYKRVKPRKS